jgi:broad specificity phosphatase PhoE
MSILRRLILVRHGETLGDSSVRFHGSGDPDLSPEGQRQMREAGLGVRGEILDLVVASPLRRSWRAAWIAGGGRPVRIDADLREVDFGRWEGLTREEIQASDPILYKEWQEGGADFRYPKGEARAEFRARVERALERLLATPVRSALLVGHKGVVRVIVQKLAGETLAPDEPALAGVVDLTRLPDGSWFRGRRSSDPAVAL